MGFLDVFKGKLSEKEKVNGVSNNNYVSLDNDNELKHFSKSFSDYLLFRYPDGDSVVIHHLRYVVSSYKDGIVIPVTLGEKTVEVTFSLVKGSLTSNSYLINYFLKAYATNEKGSNFSKDGEDDWLGFFNLLEVCREYYGLSHLETFYSMELSEKYLKALVEEDETNISVLEEELSSYKDKFDLVLDKFEKDLKTSISIPYKSKMYYDVLLQDDSILDNTSITLENGDVLVFGSTDDNGDNSFIYRSVDSEDIKFAYNIVTEEVGLSTKGIMYISLIVTENQDNLPDILNKTVLEGGSVKIYLEVSLKNVNGGVEE